MFALSGGGAAAGTGSLTTTSSRSQIHTPQHARDITQRPVGAAGGVGVAAAASSSLTASRNSTSSSGRRAARLVVRSQFDVDSSKAEQLGAELPEGPREDDVLPDSLSDAVQQAAEATATAINGGIPRCQVEILLPEFWDPVSGPIFPNRGDQERFWRMTRRFVEALSAATGVTGVKAIYPDAGVAAMLAHQWQQAGGGAADGAGAEGADGAGGVGGGGGTRRFSIDSLNARRPVAADDELIVICCPDPFTAEECQRTVRQVTEADEAAGVLPRPVVLFNQRLSSGDVGLGLNARRLRENFLKRFNITYSLRPVGEVGTVFRRYPELWKVFVEDAELPGRYRLIAERPARPAGDLLDDMIMRALDPTAADAAAAGGGGQGGGLLGSLGATVASMQRFMRSLSQ